MLIHVAGLTTSFSERCEPKLRAFIVAVFTLPVLVGCHAQLTGVATHTPVWPGPGSQSDPTLDAFLADTPLEIADRDVPPGADLTTAAMRWLILQNHPEVRAAHLAHVEAQARSRTAGRWPNPELEGRVIVADDGADELEGALRFALPIGGRLGAIGRSAELEVEQAHAELVAARNTALRELDGLLTRLSWARERLSLQEELASRSGQYAELASKRRASSVADPLDVSLVLLDAAQDSRAVIRGRTTVAALEAQVRLHLGLAPGQRQIATSSLSPPQLNVAVDDLHALAAQHCADWIRARLEYQRAEWNATAAARARIPDLVVGPAVAGTQEALSLGVAFGVALPVFAGGGSTYRAARTRRDAAHEALLATARDVQVGLDTRLARFVSLERELAELTGEAAAVASEALTLAQQRYAAGQIDVLRLLAAHRGYADLRLEILDLLRAQWDALYELEEVVGRPLRATATGGVEGR
jgi:outer membrane protein TolC